jgi:predicted nucleic acid-binding Zn ribbon protein
VTSVLIRVGRCPVCGIKVESDYGTTACSDHRDQVKAKNKDRMADLRQKKLFKEKGVN